MSRPWSPEEIALMLHLEEHGERGERLSTNQIAKLLHRTAKHVADKLHDHGRRKGRGERPMQFTSRFDKSLINEPESCRWIEGDPAEQSYCPEARRNGSAYCPEHHARAHVSTEPVRNIDALAKWMSAA